MNKFQRAVTTVPLLAFAIGGATMVGTAAAAPALSCGSVVTHSTTLTHDIGPCPNGGLVIGASNVILDLAGHSVTGTLDAYGTATTEAPGILFQSVRNSTVVNGSVSHFAVGVLISGGSNNRVAHVNAHDNIGPIAASYDASGPYGDGIDVSGSNGNNITDNTVAHNGPFSGISLLGVFSPANGGEFNLPGSSYNHIMGNTVTDNNVDFQCPPDDVGTSNCAPGAVAGQPAGNQDVGIDIAGPNALHNTVINNHVTGSGNNGIMVNPSCTGNPFGGGLCTGAVSNAYNVIAHNVSNDNGAARGAGSGISLFGMGNSYAGFAMHTKVLDNTTDGNVSNGINFTGTGCNNYAPGSTAGCAPTYNSIIGNTAEHNGNAGLFMGRDSNHNQIINNTLDNNTKYGLYLSIGTHNGSPIPGSGPTNNRFVNNTGTGNGTFDAFSASGTCAGNTFVNNHFPKADPACMSQR